MTEEQVAAMLKLLGTEDEVSTLEPKPVEPAAAFLDGLSPRSKRRLKAVQ
jgi:hypothetical protein